MSETLEFLNTLYAPYADYRAATVEVRCFPPPRFKDDPTYPKQPRAWYFVAPASNTGTVRGLPECAADVERWRETWDCYVGVLPRVHGGGKAEHLRLCSWLWVDVDGGQGTPEDAATLLVRTCHAKGLPRPHMTVFSGGGVHAYWRLSEPVLCRSEESQTALRDMMRRLVLLIGGDLTFAHADRASTDPARILRVAGTYNHKQEVRRAVSLGPLCATDPGESLRWWDEFLPRLPVARRVERCEPAGEGEGPKGLGRSTIEKITRPAGDGLKHYTMVEVAVAARKRGLSEAEVRMCAECVAANSGVDMGRPEQQRHLEGIMDWVTRNVVPDAV